MRGKTVAVHAVFALCTTLLGWVAAAPAVASTTEYGGRATALRATVSSVSHSETDTGELPPSGGNLDAASESANVPGTVSAQTLHASTIGQGSYVHSEASAGGVEITAGLLTISADLVMSRAEAEDQGGWAIRTGRSHVDGLLLNGLPVPVTGEPNQVVPVPGGELVIDDQSYSSSGGIQSITVTALRLTVGDSDIRLGGSRAGIKPAVAAQSCSGSADFATGGGWLVPPGQLLKASFGFVGGVRDADFHGHLVFRNPELNHRVKGDVIFYSGTANVRTMFGEGEVNGEIGTFILTITDAGEPGTTDNFNLQYESDEGAGTADGTIGGGNIQVHPMC